MDYSNKEANKKIVPNNAGISANSEQFNASEYRLNSKQFFEKRRKSKNNYVFDLRNSVAFKASHLPGSHNLPFEHLEFKLNSLPFTGEIMLYGGNNNEAFSAAEILYDNGFDNFYVIESYKSLLEGVDASFLDISKKAQDYFFFRFEAPENKSRGIYVSITPKTDFKAFYNIKFIELSDILPEYIFINFGDFKIYFLKECIPYLEGTKVDLNAQGQLQIWNPEMSVTKIPGTIEEQIQHVLDEEVNPMLASHGGFVNLIEVKDQNAYIKFGGGCQGCAMIDLTMKQGVESMIKEQVPEIESINDVTDHTEGKKPYYQPSVSKIESIYDVIDRDETQSKLEE